MTVWVRSEARLGRHPKMLALADLLWDAMVPAAVAECATIGLLHRLWWWAAEFAEDGDLSDYSDSQIARGVGWHGDPAALIEALRTTGFLDHDGRLHDWDEYQGVAVRERESARERMRRRRSQVERSEDDAADAEAVVFGDRSAHVRRTFAERSPNVRRTFASTKRYDTKLRGSVNDRPVDNSGQPPPKRPTCPQDGAELVVDLDSGGEYCPVCGERAAPEPARAPGRAEA